ncbi:hypothetical protein RBH29_17255 [Herbivorax sp. ANBcel31]|uniref:hypothetical protein n=1 Tax=Herbivorax sp. ANBcel31 TaxID=3069754 RepID=UPI0027B32FED|nr:hypothetical protein [Herbivorax sp. ANBcel31]MDQ2088173.1 hypothetical protein [Herbivorax sp. ANBcel31]
MFSWRISKYNPLYRDKTGAYKKDEWTSFYDIGKIFDGKELTYDTYIATENAYVEAVVSFMDSTKITSLTVKSLEKHSKDIQFTCSDTHHHNEMEDLYKKINNGIVLEIQDIVFLCRLILRDHLWCKLENNPLMFIHFGYDYYMYIGSTNKCESATRSVEKTGLFVEKFESPYYTVD